MPVVGPVAVDYRRASREAWLSNDAVHVWRADLDSAPSRVERLRRNLARDERTRAAGFHFATDRERFVAARGIVREILALYLGTPPVCLRLRQGPTGKPFLVDHRHLCFNLSHARATMLVVVAREREVGVDTERLDADASIGELAETILSKPEQRALDGLEGESRTAALLSFWTRKEALVKADGRGLSLPLSDIDVSDPAGRVTLWHEMLGSWTRCTRWLLRTPPVEAAHVAAVAAEGRNWHITHRRWPEDLADTPSIAR
jgi:4'-phosphopantetheinyl transferase